MMVGRQGRRTRLQADLLDGLVHQVRRGLVTLVYIIVAEYNPSALYFSNYDEARKRVSF